MYGNQKEKIIENSSYNKPKFSRQKYQGTEGKSMFVKDNRMNYGDSQGTVCSLSWPDPMFKAGIIKDETDNLDSVSIM
jgi:hypothetical protein